MNEIIKADLYRYNKYSGFKGFLKGLRQPGFRYTYFYRRASKGKKFSPVRLFFSWLRKRYSYKYGFQIQPNTQIGKGFYIGHFGHVVINEEATIGEYCNIAHAVTIGQVSTGKLKGTPKLGDKVWIGTGSVIVGNITIGSNVFICPNSFVNFDVPDNSLVIGNPAIIKERDNPTKGYINNLAIPENRNQ